jgi:ABC-type sulfate/molybdate transport systems ATPase subunit
MLLGNHYSSIPLFNEYTSTKRKDTILKVENLSVAYGDKVIISDINFEEKNIVRPEQIAGTGNCRSWEDRGRGKSTLFKALTGLENSNYRQGAHPDYSKQIVDGKQPAKIVQEGDVGFVNQKYTLFRHKTVLQALQFALRRSELSKRGEGRKDHAVPARLGP